MTAGIKMLQNRMPFIEYNVVELLYNRENSDISEIYNNLFSLLTAGAIL